MAEFKLGRLKFWWKGEWQTGEAYVKDDVVRFGGKSYVCIGAHTSGVNDESFYTALETAPFKWELMTDGVSWQGTWTTATYYKGGDVVKYGANSYICVDGHTSSADFWDDEGTKWNNFVNGVELEGTWSSSADYQAGDIVRYGGNAYLAKQDNTNANPATSTTNWGLLVSGLRPTGPWSSATEYKPGDVVKVSSSSYVAKQTNTNQDPEEDPTEIYWTNLVQGDDTSVLTTPGDLVYFGVSAAVRLPAGADNSVLQIDAATNLPAWKSNVQIPGTLTVTGDTTVTAGEIYQGPDAQDLTVDIGIFDVTADITQATKNGTALTFTYTEGSELGNAIVGWSLTISGIPEPNTNANTTTLITAVNTTLNTVTVVINGLSGSGAVFLGNPGDLTVELRTPTAYAGLTDANAVLVGDADSFVQVGLKNTNDGAAASTDLIVYADNGDNESGWMDMGITSSGFGSPDWTVTGNNDGYIFMNAPVGTTGNGNLVIGTGDNGVENDITFFTNGFDADHIKLRIIGKQRPETNESGVPTGNTIYPGLVVDIDTESEAYDEGAMRISGGVGLFGNLCARGDIRAEMGLIAQGTNAHRLTEDNYVGPGYVGLTNASAILTGNADSFVQVALKNTNDGEGASTDMILYGSNGDNDSGWIDMGITSENFDDPTYGVTGKGDGYIFMAAKDGSTDEGGNLFLSTSGYGTTNDIVFSTGGFEDSTFERMRIIGTARPGKAPGVEMYSTTNSTSTTTGALRVSGGIGLQGNLFVGGEVNIVGNTTIQGQIVIAGGSTTVTSQNLSVTDPMIFCGDGNDNDVVDLGVVGAYRSVPDAYTQVTLSGAGITVAGETVNIIKTAHGVQSKDQITLSGITSQPSYNGLYTSVTIVDANTIQVTKAGGTFTGVLTGTVTVGQFVNGLRYNGVVRDATDGRFKLFTAFQSYLKPSTTIDFSTATKGVLDCGSIFTTGITSSGAIGTTTLSASGDVTITSSTAATSATTGALKVTGGVGISGALHVTAASFFYNDITSWQSSDSRLKDNIAPITGALDKISKIGGYTFDWKPEAEKQQVKDVGVIAQEIQAIQPEVVVERDNGYLAVNYEKLVPLLIQGIKELQEEVAALKAKLK